MALLEVDRRKKDHGLHLQEIGDERQAERLAFFRMELGSGDVVPRDQRGDGTAVVGNRDDAILDARA